MTLFGFYILSLIDLFLKTLIVVFTIASPVLVIIIMLLKKNKDTDSNDENKKIVLIDLKSILVKRKEYMQNKMQSILDKQINGSETKKDKKNKKDEANKLKAKREEYVNELLQKQKDGLFCPKNLFVINFKGSIKADEVQSLRQKISAILDVATDKDEVIVNLTSPGGVVNGYGLCASQLQRIRDKNINLVVTVDYVAASGGYMMASVANKIVAAPFAYIGSIGVVASFPNFNKLLKKNDIDYEQVTAGKYKRTMTMFGENTNEAKEKFKEDLNLIHLRFKDHVLKYRPNLDIDKIATGEHWLASDAKELGLVDEIFTSDEYIYKRAFETFDNVLLVKIKSKNKKLFLQKLKDLLSLKALFSKDVSSIGSKVIENNDPYIDVR